jgi:hypothetical protein
VPRIPLLLLLAALACTGESTPPAPGTYDPSLDRYVEFLSQGHAEPTDYVLGLFEDHDLVIVCERFHGETTQWDLLFELVSDERFSSDVGHVFTEIGVANLQPRLDELMAVPDLSEDELRRRLLDIYRDLSFFPSWDKSNFFDFLVRVYRRNQTLEPDRQIAIHFSDMPFDWDGMTPERYADFRETLGERDRIMARQVIDGFRNLEASDDPRKKALVVMNFRHAFNDFTLDSGQRTENVGRYLFEAFPDRVANVMLNSVAILPGTSDVDAVVAPVQEGRWDAAFAVHRVSALAFEFRGSPFGEDPFDYHFRYAGSVTYADVFDGFVFYQALRDHRHHSGLPGLFDESFLLEYPRRLGVAGRPVKTAEEMRDHAAEFEARAPVPYGNIEELQAQIDRWLGDP